MLLAPGGAVAQDTAVSLDELLHAGSLQPGDGVYVTDAAGRRLKGAISDVSSGGLVVTHGGRAWTVAVADVRRIDLQDPLANGIGYGMAAVAGSISAVSPAEATADTLRARQAPRPTRPGRLSAARERRG